MVQTISYFNMTFTPRPINEITITKASDLGGTLKSTVLYRIDGKIDMGSTQITVPQGGLFLRGTDYFVSSLFSSANNYTMFIDDGVFAGNVRMSELTLEVTGTSSKVFDLDNAGNFASIEFNSVNFGDFGTATTSLGELANYRQFRTSDSGFFNLNDGLTFSGTWAGGFAIRDSIALAIPNSVTLFKEGTSLDFQESSISNINAAGLDTSVIVFDFDENNFSRDEGFALNGARFTIGGNAVPNADPSSTKVYFKDCSGVANTYGGGKWKSSVEVITPLTLNTPTKILGTTVYSNMVYFSNSTNNAFVYESTIQKDFNINVNLVIDGGANDEINVIIRQWDDSTSSYIDLDSQIRAINNSQGGNDVGYFSNDAIATMNENDRIEIWMENTTDGTDATLKIGSSVTISVRL